MHYIFFGDEKEKGKTKPWVQQGAHLFGVHIYIFKINVKGQKWKGLLHKLQFQTRFQLCQQQEEQQAYSTFWTSLPKL